MAKGIDEIKQAFAEAESVNVVGANAPPEPPPKDGDVERFRESAAYPLSDLGNGKRFVLHAGDDVMFVPRVGWHVWNGRFWEHDGDEINTRAYVQKLPDWIASEVALVELDEFMMRDLQNKASVQDKIKSFESLGENRTDEDERELSKANDKMAWIKRIEKALSKVRTRHKGFSITSGNSARLKNALSEASVRLAVDYDELDRNPFQINAENIVLRVYKDDIHGATIEESQHNRELRISKELKASYVSDEKCPQFDKFIERILPDPSIREFLQRWFGLSMTAFTGDQKMVFLYGAGANGKSVLVDLMARIMGSYAATARIESLTGSNRRGGGDATPDLIPLMGARMVRTSEPDEGQRLQEGLIKEMTGGEPMMVRALHSDFVEITPVFKLTMSGNHKPEIRGTDDGIWRRLLLVPFDVQIPQGERDPKLGEKLWEERSGILNWLMAGLCDYIDNGLQIPPIIRDATAEYREESDPIMTYLLECCEITGNADNQLKSKELAEGFNLFRQSRSMGPWTDNTISRKIKEKSERWSNPTNGHKFTYMKSSVVKYAGIKFTSEFEYLMNSAERDARGRLVLKEGSSDQ